MDKERKPEVRMNQGPLVPEQIGNLQKTKKKTLIMKMLDAFLIALLVLSSVIVVVSMFGHHISAMFTKSLAEKTEPKQEVTEGPDSHIQGRMPPADRWEFAEPEGERGR